MRFLLPLMCMFAALAAHAQPSPTAVAPQEAQSAATVAANAAPAHMAVNDFGILIEFKMISENTSPENGLMKEGIQKVSTAQRQMIMIIKIENLVKPISGNKVQIKGIYT